MNILLDKIANIFVDYVTLMEGVGIDIIGLLLLIFSVSVLSAFEFFVYRYISHKHFYNRAFNITLAVLPYFIGSIVMCLQMNVVITLGTIGALAIIRFRTAVKDPIDMLYLLWAIHNGIVCGCQLFGIGFIVSVTVAIVLLILENLPFSKKPYILIIKAKTGIENELDRIIGNKKSYRIKSRNFSKEGIDYSIELKIKDMNLFLDELKKLDIVDKFTIIEYNLDDVI